MVFEIDSRLRSHAGPTAPPNSPRDPDEVDLLLQFVRERDVHCPRCDYNLRNLTQPYCPECREELFLTVGLRRPKIGLFLAAIAPGVFCGILSLALAVIMIKSPGAPIEIIVTTVGLFISGLFTLGVIYKRHAFLWQPDGQQLVWMMVIWTLHLTAFGLFVYYVP